MFDDVHQASAVSASLQAFPEPLDLGAARRLAEVIGGRDEPDRGMADLPQIGDYVIDRRLGQGGAGVVYHGLLPGWNDEFAIKVLHHPVAGGRDARRVQRELDVVERLDLPDTPRVYEYGLHEGRLFIVSEHVDGVPLDAHCRDRGLDVRGRVALLVEVARAVHGLHERGVLHRDLKPANVLVRPDGSPVIIDLGIATLLDGDPAESRAADSGAGGSVAVMAPEQARGERSSVSIQSDVYGLGATACALLTGETPHDLRGATPLEAINRVGHERARDPRELDPRLPAGLAAILRRALAPEPADRFASVAEMADELRCWLEDRPVRSQRSSWWRNRLLSVRRHPARWAWGTVAVAGALALGGFATAAEVRQAFVEQHRRIVGKASLDMVARLRDGRFREALNLMALLEDNVRLGTFESDDPRIQEIRRNRERVLAEVIRAVHADRSEPPTDRELALAAVRAIYERDGAWDEQVGVAIDGLLSTLE